MCSSLFLAFQFPGTSQATLSITPCFPTPLSVFAQSKDLLAFFSNLFLPTLLHSCCCPDLPLPGSAPCLLPFPHCGHVCSQHPLLTQACTRVLSPSLLSPFSSLTWTADQISLPSSLLICCLCFFSCWSSFSTPSTLCVPSYAGPFSSPAHCLLA